MTDTTAAMAHTPTLAAVIAERNAYKGKSLARGKLLERFRDEVHNICDNAADEGDRAYFGSTNDLDALRDIVREMESWKWDAVMKERPLVDPYAECRSLRELIATLCEAAEKLLRTAETELKDADHALGVYETRRALTLARARIGE